MTISFYDKIYTLFTGNMEIPGDIQLESVSLIFPWKGHAAGLVLLPLFVGTIFHAKWKAAEYHPSPSPNCYAPTRQNNIFPLSFQFSPVHPTFLLHFQTRTLCSAMRRQMAIQLFIARMGSWIWQDIHARKLCKRVRTNHRTDSTYLTLEYSFVCIVPIFIQLPTKHKYPKTPAPNSAVHETGCSCHFLYGPDTKEEHKQQIEKSLSNKMELKLEVIFYKKEGKPSAKLPLCGNAVRIVFYLPRF